MAILNFENLAPTKAPDGPEKLTYNGKIPDKHIIVELVWHPKGNEILEHRCIPLTPCRSTVDCIEQELEEHLTPVFDDLPTRGVWRVVVAGTMGGCHYDTVDGSEYDEWVDWDILSANKFPDFGALKEWFKNWKKEQRQN